MISVSVRAGLMRKTFSPLFPADAACLKLEPLTAKRISPIPLCAHARFVPSVPHGQTAVIESLSVCATPRCAALR